MSDDLRITGKDKRAAPRLMVEFTCEKCEASTVLDAYEGPPTCGGYLSGDRVNGRLRPPIEDNTHHPTFMKAVRIVEDA